MPEDENRDGLRIGGWVPPYRDSAYRDSAYRDSAPEPEPRRGKARKVPAFLRSLSPRRQPTITDDPEWTPPVDVSAAFEGDPTRRSRLVLAAAAGVVVAVIVTFALVGLGETPPPQNTDSLVAPPPPPLPVPSAAVSILPAPSSSPTPSRTSRSVKPSPSKTKKPTPTKTVTPDGVLVAGSTIGLEIAGYSGYRLVHYGSDVEIDRVDADSSADDRAGTRFRVRKGLGSSSCLSFESADEPGHYLRHRDFELRLDDRDGSDLFDQDATFCPRSSRGGVELHAANYPDRALSAGRGEIRLDDDHATTFAVKPPL
jgi:hypothetical protein